MTVDPFPVAKAVAIAGVDGPLRNIRIEVLVLVEFDRDTVEPLQEELHILRIDHEPACSACKARPNDDFLALVAKIDIVVCRSHRLLGLDDYVRHLLQSRRNKDRIEHDVYEIVRLVSERHTELPCRLYRSGR